jgi:hypothetical protein
VTKDGVDAKLWLYPEVDFAYNKGFDVRTQRRLVSIVEMRRRDIEDVWNDHFT